MVAPNTSVRLMPGKTYLYSYTGRLVSGIAQFGDSAAVLEIKSDIVLQPEQGGSQVAMQVRNGLICDDSIWETNNSIYLDD